MRKVILNILVVFLIVGCSSSSDSTYTLTNAEEGLFNSISGQELGQTHKSFDTNGEETSLLFQQTLDINSLQVGDSAILKYNTIIAPITNTDGETVILNTLNTSTLTVSDIVGIKGGSSGLILGSATDFKVYYEGTTESYSIYVSSNDSILLNWDTSFIFPDGTTFLGSIIRNREVEFEYNSTSHDNVPCNPEISVTLVLYTTENVPVSTTQDTNSGYAEIILYNINNGNETYLKACI